MLLLSLFFCPDTIIKCYYFDIEKIEIIKIKRTCCLVLSILKGSKFILRLS